MGDDYDEEEIQETIYEASQWIEQVLNDDHLGSESALAVRLFEQDIRELSEIDDDGQYHFDPVLIWNIAVENVESYAKLEKIKVDFIPEINFE